MKDNTLDSLGQEDWAKLIASILRPILKFTKRDPLVTYEDLEQEAWVALLSAAKTYDPTKAKFTTFAYYHIRGRMLRYVLERTKLSPQKLDTDPTEIEPGYLDVSLENDDRLSTILEAIKDDPHAHLLVEHFMNGKSYRTLAKEYGGSHQGVALNVNRLLKTLAHRVDHENA